MATETTEQTKHSESKAPLIGPLELTKEALVIYKNNFYNFLPIYLAFGLQSALSDINGSLAKAKLFSFPFPQITTVVLEVFSLYLTIVLILAMKKKLKNVELVDNEAMSKMRPIFFLSLLYGLIISGGTILLIIPGIIFAIWYMFGTYILLTENLGIRDSLTKSKFYVKNHFWEVFRIQFSLTFLTLILYVMIYLIFVAMTGLFFHSVQPPQLLINIVTAIVSIPLSGFILPLGIIYTFRLYTHLKAISPAHTTTRKTSH